ncbi:hypothetical protein Cgig2_030794 [Carnegiea gigantea]|uniref:Uncharacterized protein n=1 Tax=Carnegiea gigantea TaxID=171969 RepID=A0A9Q1KU46_9CARY|nr:hypothetical protein Cgig2_030794 [Carnegiea gigantea]
MELSQSRAFQTAQGRNATHDFLSLCSHSSVQLQETRPTHGGFLKTHNFLQLSEVEEKNARQEDNSADINFEKPSPGPSALEQVLPGGIGTFTISHISNLNLRLPKSKENVLKIASVPGNDRNGENSNWSSYTGSGFTSWDESVARKRNSRKENFGDTNVAKGELRVKIDGKSSDQKPNTPRSRHSATEQRRRCKINERQVIEYLQFLQEKVNRYEGSYPGWNSEPAKLIPWRNHLGPSKSLADQPRIVNRVASPMLVSGAKLDEEASAASSNIQRNTQIPEAPKATNTIDFKTIDQQSTMTYKAVPNSLRLQSDVYDPYGSNCAEDRPSTRLSSEADEASLAQLQLRQNRMSASEPVADDNELKDQEPALESRTISISSIYSQGLLDTLTEALQSSGVDLSLASIAVQVDIGKRANNRHHGPDPVEKVIAEAPCCDQFLLHTRVESTSLESDRAAKTLKTI